MAPVPIVALWQPLLAELRAEQSRRMAGHWQFQPPHDGEINRFTQWRVRQAQFIGPHGLPPILIPKLHSYDVRPKCRLCGRRFVASHGNVRYWQRSLFDQSATSGEICRPRRANLQAQRQTA
jgi:hypothetical protein